MSQVIDMPLKGLDLRDVVLFFLLEFFDHKLRASHILFHVKTFLVELALFFSQLLDGFLMPLVLDLRVSVVLQDILLFNFKSTNALLS